jgi:type I site-specific restriction-modification system R (restriction) subunit
MVRARRFAALRPEPRWESAASEGTDLDLKRLVAAAVDLKAGHSPRPDWFLRFHRRRQPLAILTLIDTSGSTLGGTLSQELDAIVLLSEGLDALAWPDIHDRASLEANFREKFEALNRVRLTESEFARLLEEIVTPDVFTAAKTLRQINAFTRDDGTPLNYTLVNLKDWCKNTFEVVNQLRINHDYSHHRFDVLILINGVPVTQIELKTLGVNPRRAMEQIVEYKNDPGNGYTKTLLCFLQLFIVSNRDQTFYFANNNKQHFAFNADERFLPVYEFADEGNR